MEYTGNKVTKFKIFGKLQQLSIVSSSKAPCKRVRTKTHCQLTYFCRLAVTRALLRYGRMVSVLVNLQLHETSQLCFRVTDAESKPLTSL